jgi:ATP-dependent DNA helicase RecG
VRTGPSRSIANAQEERILNEKRQYKDQPYDLHPIGHAKLSDLSRAFFEDDFLPKAFAQDVLDANNRTYEERLSALKMIYSVNDPIPTVLGVLTIGKKPQDFIWGSFIQFCRIRGIKITDYISDAMEIKGTISKIVEQIEMVFSVNNCISDDVSSGHSVRIADYPLIAFQQIVYNALMHRSYESSSNAPVRVYWYDDRIEIISSGGTGGDVNSKTFGTPGLTYYRNPNIADVFKSLGYIQHFGMGIYLAQASMKNNGNPPIDFEINTGFVTAILRGKK